MTPELALPADLTELDQWVLWEYQTRSGKRTKVPVQPNHKAASATDPKTWRSYAEVCAAQGHGFSGIGFVFTPGDPYAGVDLDNCLTPEGCIKDWAVEFLQHFHDTYAEISPSGLGVKIFTKGKLPGRGRRRNYPEYSIEVYDQGRFFTVTGNALNGSPREIEEHQADIDRLYALLAPESTPQPKAGEPITQGSRHKTLVSMAGAMRRRGMSPEAIDAALWAENQARCIPPYDHKHIAQIAQSAERWVPEPSLSAAVPAQEPQSIADHIDISNLPDKVEDCYLPKFVESVALLHLNSQFDVKKALRAKFGKEFHSREFERRVNASSRPAAEPSSIQGLICSDNGNPKAVLANAIIQLKASGVDLAYDTFASKLVIREPSPWGTSGAWSDRDSGEAANYLQHQNILVGSLVAREAAYLLAHQHQFHPVREWLTGLRWSGEQLLDTWFSRLLGAEDTPLMRSACRKWTISAVGRIMEPGCKADHMIVLEGPEGKLKSTALHALINGHPHKGGGIQWFRDRMPDIDKKDVELYMQGVWLIEIAELDAIRGKEWTRVNAFISSAKDTFRVPYGHEMMDYPRQCVFAASTNEEHWNATPYGGRRFWPVPVKSVSIPRIIEEREQIFAEAMFAYSEGETNFLSHDMEIEMRKKQSDRAPDDPWMERIQTKTALDTDTSVAELLDKLGERHTPANAQHAGAALKRLGWERYRPTGENRQPRWRVRELP